MGRITGNKVGCPRTTEEAINARLPKYLKIDYSTFDGQQKRARFIDKDYGECFGVVNDVLRKEGPLHKDRCRLEFLNKIQTRLPKELTLDFSTYKSYKKKVRLIDSEYGDWWVRLEHVFNRGMSHPQRLSEGQKFLNHLSEEEINKRIPDYLKVDFSTFVSSNAKARFIDLDYGDFWQLPWNVFKSTTPLHPERRRIELCKGIQSRLSERLTLDFSTFSSYLEEVRIVDSEIW